MSLAKFKENLGGGGSYLKGKDFEDGREVAIQPWIFDNKVINFLPYYEAWIWEDKKKGKKKPVRVTVEEFESGQIDPSDYEFSSSEYMGKNRVDSFKPCLAFLFRDITTHSLKLASFSQSTLVQALIGYLDPEEKFYVKNITNKIIVIGKRDERTWQAVVKDDDDEVTDNDKWENALDGFTFSWDAYLKSEDPFDCDTTIQDVVDMIGDAPEKKKSSSAKKSSAKKDEDWWKSIKTPKGTPLGSLKHEQLVEIKTKMKNRDSELYKAVIAGLIALENEEYGFEDEEIGF